MLVIIQNKELVTIVRVLVLSILVTITETPNLARYAYFVVIWLMIISIVMCADIGTTC